MSIPSTHFFKYVCEEYLTLTVAAQNFCQKISKLLSKLFGKYFPALTQQNRDLGRVNVYVGGDGKLHFVNSGGADSVLPFNNKPTYYVVSTGRELAVSTYAESSVKITIPDKEGKTVVGGYITNIRVYNSNGNLEEAPIRCNYANKVLTVISSAGKWSSGWTAYYFDVVGIYI